MKLWNLLHGVPLAGEYPNQDMEITSISYDTRTLEPGALFVALPGAREDGADYIREALEKGAAAVLGETPPEGENWFQTPGRTGSRPQTPAGPWPWSPPTGSDARGRG